MKQQEVFKKIGGIIKELNEQYDYLKTVDGHLNDLELELFIANSHFLTDHVVILSKLNSQSSTDKKTAPKPAPQEEKFFEPLVQVPAKNKPIEKPVELPGPEIDLGDTGNSYSFMQEEEPDTIRHELILDEADWEDEDEPVAAEASNEEEIEIPVPLEKTIPARQKEEKEVIEPVAEEPKETPPLKETPPAKTNSKEDILSINDKISAQLAEKAGIADQLHSQSISDLKQAINLNDKLLYIKDLFNGYSLAYSEAIEILNRFNSFDEAELFLSKNYLKKNNWENKPETQAKFYTLLKRRYA